MKGLYLDLSCLLLPFLVAAQSVFSINVDGTINPASAAFIKTAIGKAGNNKAECLIIHLNTPGGLLKSTRDIVGAIPDSPIPVIVYVFPGGAHAGSAGVFITYWLFLLNILAYAPHQ